MNRSTWWISHKVKEKTREIWQRGWIGCDTAAEYRDQVGGEEGETIETQIKSDFYWLLFSTVSVSEESRRERGGRRSGMTSRAGCDQPTVRWRAPIVELIDELTECVADWVANAFTWQLQVRHSVRGDNGGFDSIGKMQRAGSRLAASCPRHGPRIKHKRIRPE